MKIAIKLFLVMLLLTGLLYPFIITVLGQFLMPYQSNGSLLIKDNRIRGSELIAQKMIDTKYFWPRPSAIDYNPLAPSGGSGLSPTSLQLKNQIVERQKQFGKQTPPEMLFTSASGLDPHISKEVAYYQIERISKARALNPEKIKFLIDTQLEKQGFLFKSYLNVLLLNQSLDEISNG